MHTTLACAETELPVHDSIDFAGGAAMLTGAQIRAARALLRWRNIDLAEAAGLSFAAIQRAEAGDGVPNMLAKSLVAIRAAFEKAGVVFIESGDYSGRGGPGVRLRK